MFSEKEYRFRYANESGEVTEYEMIYTFKSEETERNYMIYTDNTVDENGHVKVFASIYDPYQSDLKLYPILTEREWDIVEKALQKALAEG